MNHSSVKILIADDDDVSCKILNAMLNCHGYKSQCTSNGQECFNTMNAYSAPSRPSILIESGHPF